MTDKKEDKEKEGHCSYINAQSCLPILQSYHRYCCCHETHRAEYSAEHIIFLSLADAEGKITYQKTNFPGVEKLKEQLMSAMH